LPRAIVADPYLFQTQILIFAGVAPTRETPFGMVDAASDGQGAGLARPMRHYGPGQPWSAPTMKAIGMIEVAALAASVVALLCATITVT
jgi:hypothetical protein